MNLLQAENITKSYGDLVLFQNISISIHKDEVVALIAKNGAGKTSLLNIITGVDSADSGNIVFRNDVTIGYLQQNPIFNPDDRVFDAIYNSNNESINFIKQYEKALKSGNNIDLQDAIDKMDISNSWDYESKIKQILSQLKITDFNEKICTLSGGQIKRVALANLLINKPDILILDEPTNHLDLEMIEWLEDYFINNNLTILMVTHDRYFLDRVCTQILEIDNKQIYSYKGNYSYFLEKRQERVENKNSEIEKARNLFHKELDWIRRMPKARTTKAKYRVDAFDDIKEKAFQNTNEKNVKLNVKTTRLGQKVLEIHYLSKSYGDKVLFKDFEYLFKQYEKIGIVGKNGTGKTSFLNVITGSLKADSGKFEVGETVVFGYYKQEGIIIDDNKKVIDVVKEVAEVVTLGDGSKMSVSQFLNYFLFPSDRQYVQVSKLSGGEKRRLYLMTVLMKNPNFLILDEPTNDLDLYTLNVLEDYLENFKGCVLMVSHDRYFMDKLTDHIFAFEGDGIIKDFPGNYTDYREKKDKEELITAKNQKKESIVKKDNQDVTFKNPKKLTYKEKIELDEIEKEIEALEFQKNELEQQINSGMFQGIEIVDKSNELNDLINIIDDKSIRWLELSEKANM